jgi:hypothetical protein
MKYLTVITFTLLTFFACKKDNNTADVTCDTEGNILSVDLALCPCCGGLFLEMDGDTFYVLSMPEIEFTDNAFPKAAKFDWEVATGDCANIRENTINLSCLEIL